MQYMRIEVESLKKSKTDKAEFSYYYYHHHHHCTHTHTHPNNGSFFTVLISVIFLGYIVKFEDLELGVR